MITIATLVKNEADRLPKALECWTALAGRIVAVDNGSTDGTQDILANSGAEVHHHSVPMEGNEAACRALLWDHATADGGWVVWADADQVFAGDFRPFLAGSRVVFPVFDMWSPTEYRADQWWRVHPWWQAVNADKLAGFEPEWAKRGWHSGHVPVNTGELGPAHPIPYECGVLHYGYASPELRERHFDAYMARRAYLTPTEIMHARTILDPDPHVVDLPFEPAWTLL